MNDLTKYDFSQFEACDFSQDLKLGSAGSQRWSRGLLRMQERIGHAGSDLQAVMDTVVAGAIEIISRADGAVVALREGDEIVAHAAGGSAAARCGMRARIDHSFSGRALVERRPVMTDDAEQDPSTDQAARRQIEARSIMAVPVPYRGEIVGALTIYSRRPRAFAEGDLLTAELLAGPLAIGFASATEAVALAARERAELRFAATFEQAAVGIAHVSTDGRFLMVNRKFCEIAGYGREQLLNATFQDITYADDLDIDLGYLKSLVAGEIPSYALEKRYVRADGKLTWILLTVSLVRDAGGAPDFFVGVIEDINARKQAELESLHDPLTGLLNRRGAMIRLERELGRSGLSGEPITVAYLDLDGFKALNDTQGHAEGDRCLVRTGAALVEACRPGDVVARLGGDEFLLLLPGLPDETAPIVLQRLLEAVKGNDCPVRASIGALTVAGGVAAPLKDVLSGADRLMYEAKRGGRDRYVLQRWLPRAAAA